MLKNNKKFNSLLAPSLIGIILIIIFFIGGNACLLRQDIANWPNVTAEVVSVEHKNVCEAPEVSSACYDVFFIKYAYLVNGKKYINQLEQTFLTSYFAGKKFNVYYKRDNPQIVFAKEEIPNRARFYLPLILGLLLFVPVVILVGQYLRIKIIKRYEKLKISRLS